MENLESYLNEVKQRMGAATEGPWYWAEEYGVYTQTSEHPEYETICSEIKLRDAPFVAFARTDLERLYKMVEMMRDEMYFCMAYRNYPARLENAIAAVITRLDAIARGQE